MVVVVKIVCVLFQTFSLLKSALSTSAKGTKWMSSVFTLSWNNSWNRRCNRVLMVRSSEVPTKSLIGETSCQCLMTFPLASATMTRSVWTTGLPGSG